MYVYSQGRRINRRKPSQSNLGVSIGIQTEERYSALEEVIQRSLSLWGEADQKLERLENTLSKEGSGLKRNILAEKEEPHIGRNPRSFNRSDSQASVFTCADDSEGLKERLRILQLHNAELQSRLRDAEERSSSAQRRIHQLEVESKRFERYKAVRRYHFVQDSKGLLSTFSNEAFTAKSKLGQFYYEVKLSGTGTHLSEEGKDASASAAHSRFTYTDHLVRATSKIGSGPSMNSEKILEWLMGIDPRTYADAGPLLILAKSILSQLVEESLSKIEVERTAFEKEKEAIKMELETLLKAKETELNEEKANHAAAIQKLKQENTNRLEALQTHYDDLVLYHVTFPFTLLRFRNGALTRKLRNLKDKYEDLRSKTALEVIATWNDGEKVAVLRKLLENESLLHTLPQDFILNSSMAEVSMVSFCQQLMLVLEMKHAGRLSWLKIVSDVFMTDPHNLGRKVLSWYHPDAAISESALLDNEVKAALQRTYHSHSLSEMRNDLCSGVRDIWDIAAAILQIPKANAFAELMGFSAEDEDVVFQLWPEFIIWFQQQCQQLISVPDPALVAAAQRLEKSPTWDQLKLKDRIRRFAGFDLDDAPSVTRYSLEEISRIIASIIGEKERENESRRMPMPVFVRDYALLKTGLRSSASSFLLKIQAAVRACYKGNSRVRTFGRISGMVHPLRFMEASERVLRTFWEHLMLSEGSLPNSTESPALNAKLDYPRLGTWMEADRAVDKQSVVRAAQVAFETHILPIPASDIMPTATELSDIILPAAVKAPVGTRLPAKDLEKLAIDNDPQAILDGSTVSLDLVSDIILDVFVKIVRKWEESFRKLWTVDQEMWDWGSKQQSPDLDSLRLFLAKRCNLNVPNCDLVTMYKNMTNHDDDIDPDSAAAFCFQYLANATRLSHDDEE